MTIKQRPTCFIIAGPNGAGKTTFALRYLPTVADCRNFVNADLIAHGLSPFDSLSVQYEAGRIFLREIHSNIAKRVDFAFETTLAGHSLKNLFKKLRQDGWKLVLFFLWIPDADFSKNRIQERVKTGGHGIPETTIYRRFGRVMHNFIDIYVHLCDNTVCYDNSGSEPVLVFEQEKKDCLIYNHDVYNTILRYSDDISKTQ